MAIFIVPILSYINQGSVSISSKSLNDIVRQNSDKLNSSIIFFFPLFDLNVSDRTTTYTVIDNRTNTERINFN